jgi:hypothetical protein
VREYAAKSDVIHTEIAEHDPGAPHAAFRKPALVDRDRLSNTVGDYERIGINDVRDLEALRAARARDQAVTVDSQLCEEGLTVLVGDEPHEHPSSGEHVTLLIVDRSRESTEEIKMEVRCFNQNAIRKRLLVAKPFEPL